MRQTDLNPPSSLPPKAPTPVNLDPEERQLLAAALDPEPLPTSTQIAEFATRELLPGPRLTRLLACTKAPSSPPKTKHSRA